MHQRPPCPCPCPAAATPGGTAACSAQVPVRWPDFNGSLLFDALLGEWGQLSATEPQSRDPSEEATQAHCTACAFDPRYAFGNAWVLLLPILALLVYEVNEVNVQNDHQPPYFDGGHMMVINQGNFDLPEHQPSSGYTDRGFGNYLLRMQPTASSKAVICRCYVILCYLQSPSTPPSAMFDAYTCFHYGLSKHLSPERFTQHVRIGIFTWFHEWYAKLLQHLRLMCPPNASSQPLNTSSPATMTSQ